MSGDPYQSPQSYGGPSPTNEAPNPLGLILGIVSIVTGLFSLFPGCCCIVIGAPLALIAIGTGIGGIVSADERQPIGKILGIIGLVIGGLYVLMTIAGFILQAVGVITPEMMEQFQSDL